MMSDKQKALICCAALISAGTASAATHQWTVANLHPPTVVGRSGSEVFGIHNGQQVGTTYVGSTPHASLWTCTAESWVSLTPPTASSSRAYGVHNGQQVGSATIGTLGRASLWNGTAESFVNLAPDPHSGASSRVNGVCDDQQVGYVGAAPSLWSGTPESWVNLKPPGTTSYCEANGVHNGQQVGTVSFPDTYVDMFRASLWSGTVESWINLHPESATQSGAQAIHNGQQVGWVIVDGAYRASLWTGTAESWVDLNPKVATESGAFGVFDGMQVGYAIIDGVSRASLWQGTAESWEALPVPPGWGYTRANCVWTDGETIYVGGIGLNGDTGRGEALLWTRSMSCHTDFTDDGMTDLDDLQILLFNFGQASSDGDTNGDGVVDLNDLQIVLFNFGQSC